MSNYRRGKWLDNPENVHGQIPNCMKFLNEIYMSLVLYGQTFLPIKKRKFRLKMKNNVSDSLYNG